MLMCDTCPRYKDSYPGKLDRDGYHFGICGLTGNKVYAIPHRIKRLVGRGYMELGVSTCGLYNTVEDALAHMTASEVRRWEEERNAT